MDEHKLADIIVTNVTDIRQLILASQHENLVFREAFNRKMNNMQAELGWETATSLERLLIDQIVLCWKHLHDTITLQTEKTKQGISPDKSVFFDKAVDRSQRRYLHAVQSLALIRRMELPAVQLNFAKKQVNIVQGSTAHMSVQSPKCEKESSPLLATETSGIITSQE